MRLLADREILSVQETNLMAKDVLEHLSFWVEGEVFDFKSADQRYYYVYFSLKEGEYLLPCIFHRPVYQHLGFGLENGQQILAHGKFTVFKTGRMQFVIDQAEVAGEGLLAKELEEIKARLQAEGLLSEERKRPLPRFPVNIGVITSAESDAWADFQRHSIQKFPIMKLSLADAFVQGRRAVPSLLRAINLMQQQPLDVLVIIRGGGSAEDLAAFNDEQVARAIAASRIPTLVGVGHEKDVSIADLVADVRASTPTNAGQILTKPYEEVSTTLEHARSRLGYLAEQQTERSFQSLDLAAHRLSQVQHKYQALPFRLSSLSAKLEHQYHRLIDGNSVATAAMGEKLQLVGKAMYDRNGQKLGGLGRQLQAVSPMGVLERGYSIITIDEKVVRSSRQTRQGDTISIRLAKGRLRGLVTRIEE